MKPERGFKGHRVLTHVYIMRGTSLFTNEAGLIRKKNQPQSPLSLSLRALQGLLACWLCVQEVPESQNCTKTRIIFTISTKVLLIYSYVHTRTDKSLFFPIKMQKTERERQWRIELNANIGRLTSLLWTMLLGGNMARCHSNLLLTRLFW